MEVIRHKSLESLSEKLEEFRAEKWPLSEIFEFNGKHSFRIFNGGNTVEFHFYQY